VDALGRFVARFCRGKTITAGMVAQRRQVLSFIVMFMIILWAASIDVYGLLAAS